MIKNKGKHKKFLATNEISATCTQGAQFFFLLQTIRGRAVDILDFLVPNVFLNMFPIAPHFVPYVFIK
jgi:hypothetical protein